MNNEPYELETSHLSPAIQHMNGARPVNVSQVKQLSPFRYPGGKTWCVPAIRRWIGELPRKAVFVEPFAGGAIASLTVAVENLADRVVMAELDPDVAAVWTLVLEGSDTDFAWLCRRILNFEVSRKSVGEILNLDPVRIREKAFRTILKNRVNRGGIMAPGASLVKGGENGRGLKSRWYPETLVGRLKVIRAVRGKISFFHDDAFKIMKRYRDSSQACFFIDPPYTAGGKRAGSRLYAHNQIDHELLFSLLSKVSGDFLATYDDAEEVRALAEKCGFSIETVQMKSTHHAVVSELLISG